MFPAITLLSLIPNRSCCLFSKSYQPNSIGSLLFEENCFLDVFYINWFSLIALLNFSTGLNMFFFNLFWCISQPLNPWLISSYKPFLFNQTSSLSQIRNVRSFFLICVLIFIFFHQKLDMWCRVSVFSKIHLLSIEKQPPCGQSVTLILVSFA